MNNFDIASTLIATAAVSSYVNHRLLRLPATSGVLVVSLVSSLLIVVGDAVIPGFSLADRAAAFLSEIDFNETLMHGMLSFLLFAGALHVDLEGLLRNKWTIGLLATVGVVLSTGIIGGLTWYVFQLVGVHVPLVVCFVFGALISPTDPIAVMGLLKELEAPKSLESQIAGESLFNDGVGVVIFFALVSIAGVPTEGATATATDTTGLATFFLREVGGGAALGFVFGALGYRALKSIDEHSLELLITLALAMFLYSFSFWIHVSGPIAVVVAGLLIGNPGRRFAMSARTREHVDAFWSMIEEILNALLFLLLGIEVFGVSAARASILAALIVIPVVLLARFVAVGIPVLAIQIRQPFARGIVPVLTWAGLRGGISIAMVLSLPPFPARDLLFVCTYGVVVFSVIVQGLSVRRVLIHYGMANRPAA